MTLVDACKRGGGDIQTGPFGSQLHAADYQPVGIPSIMPQNIGDKRVIEDGIVRITPEDARRLSRYLVQTGDIVYSRRGDVERRALIRKKENGWLCGTGYGMRDHNLMQAIARVNRVFRDKEDGLVVEYIGIAAELRRALRTYTENRGKGQPTLGAAEALAKLKELTDVARGILDGFDYSAYRDQAAGLLLPAANFVLGPEDGKKRWFDVVLAITKAFSLCGTLDEAIELREEIAFFQAIKSVIAKATESDKKLSEDRKNAVLKQILDNAVVAEGVEDIFKLAGLDRPDIGILSDAFLEEVRNLPQRNFAVELLQKLLNDEIKSRSRTNVILEKKFSDRLIAALNRYRSRAIESAQVIEELIAMAKEFREAAKRGENLGLNETELAFYDALADNESAVRELGDEILARPGFRNSRQ